jgi:hypothetical protein
MTLGLAMGLQRLSRLVKPPSAPAGRLVAQTPPERGVDVKLPPSANVRQST